VFSVRKHKLGNAGSTASTAPLLAIHSYPRLLSPAQPRPSCTRTRTPSPAPSPATACAPPSLPHPHTHYTRPHTQRYPPSPPCQSPRTAADYTGRAGRAITERQRDRETERQRDRETERQRDRETERQRDREGALVCPPAPPSHIRTLLDPPRRYQRSCSSGVRHRCAYRVQVTPGVCPVPPTPRKVNKAHDGSCKGSRERRPYLM